MKKSICIIILGLTIFLIIMNMVFYENGKKFVKEESYAWNEKEIYASDHLIGKNSFQEIKEIMEKTVYKAVFTQEEDFEQEIDQYLYDINKKIFQNDIMSVAYIFAYINIIDYENNDIINTIEGIRYNMDKKEILKRLVR